MVVTVAAHKGGVGKSTTAVHVAAYLQKKAPTRDPRAEEAWSDYLSVGKEILRDAIRGSAHFWRRILQPLPPRPAWFPSTGRRHWRRGLYALQIVLLFHVARTIRRAWLELMSRV